MKYTIHNNFHKKYRKLKSVWNNDKQFQTAFSSLKNYKQGGGNKNLENHRKAISKTIYYFQFRESLIF